MEVLLFGMIAEEAGAERIDVDCKDIDELISGVEAVVPTVRRLSYAVTIDRKIVTGNRKLSGKEEVALLPPFAGG